MGIQKLCEGVILVDLPAEPALNEELKCLTEIVCEGDDCNVILDFSRADIVTSSSISKLLKLRKLVLDCGRLLVLCNMATATKSIFAVTALLTVFDIVDDCSTAAARIESNVLR
jgi:anti-anti-sigma regulatory factor